MSTPADTFAAFVAVLSEAMDDPDPTAADLTDRLHVSRSHLDHLVSAIAGESPARLRRRVLLERAAWRLLTSDVTVLDAATEAGYGSNEAFTRAFTQAYGHSPAAWRLEPTVVRLPSESGVHFSPPAGLRLPGQANAGVTMISTIVEHHVWVIGAMITAARTLTDDQLDQEITISVAGIDDHPSLRRLLSRLVGQMDMWNTVINMGDYDFSVETHEPLDDLVDRLARVGPAFLDQVRRTDARGGWTDTFVDAFTRPPRFFTYGAMIAHVLTYAGHRKTLVAGALESAGVTGFEDDPLAWIDDPARKDDHAADDHD